MPHRYETEWIVRGMRCQDCGIRTRKVQFHHRDPSMKRFMLAESGKGALEWHMEALACDMLCRRCHRLRHWAMEQEERNRREFRAARIRIEAEIAAENQATAPGAAGHGT